MSALNGEPGADGASTEYVYYQCAGTNEDPAPTTPPFYQEGVLKPDGWSPSPKGVTPDNPYEYMSVRTKPAGAEEFSTFSTPVIWSKWGEKGQDGDGVVYHYYLYPG